MAQPAFSDCMSRDQFDLLSAGYSEGWRAKYRPGDKLKELRAQTRLDFFATLKTFEEKAPTWKTYLKVVNGKSLDVFAGDYYLLDRHRGSLNDGEQMKCILFLMPEMKYLYHKFGDAIDEIDSLKGEIQLISIVFSGHYPAPFIQYMAYKCYQMYIGDPKTLKQLLAPLCKFQAYLRHLTYLVVLIDNPKFMDVLVDICKDFLSLKKPQMFQQSLYAVLEARIPQKAENYSELVKKLFDAAAKGGFRMGMFGSYSCVLNDRVVEPMDTTLALMLSDCGVRLHPIAYSVLCKEHRYMGDIDAFLCLTKLVS